MKITRQIISCAALVLLTAATAFSTNPSTSGALLTINGTVTEGENTMNVSLSVSDKDIHSGNFQTVPVGNGENGSNCTAADQVSTDAYVLQAGAPTGCDPGNTFEGGLTAGSFSFSSEGGLVSYNLGVSTSYWINEGSKCNTRETICSNNTSFLTVSNNGSSSFTGTITLAASSLFCGTNGLVFDSFTGTLAASGEGASVTLALATDASSCGGFTSLSQTQTLQPGVQSIYTFFNDKYKITPSFNTGGESLTITFVPVLYSAFTPPPNFPNEACVPFADISPTDPNAPLSSDVCGTYQADCSVGGVPNGGDCTTLLYTVLESYDLPPNLPAIGGPDGLIVHGVGCPTSGVNAESIFYSYSVTRIDPTTTVKGKGTGSCFEVTYTPGAPLITSGTTSSFFGFEFPVSNTRLNPIFIPLPVWLSWDYRNSSSGNPVTNLNLCNNTTGLGCTAPWVNLGAIPIACPAGPATGPEVPISSVFNTGLLNFGGGEYSFFWNTAKGFKKGTCVSVVLTFNTGLTVFPASFKFH
jgi:hypothetical protein